MTESNNSVFHYCELLRQKAPEYFNLLTAPSDQDFEQAFDALLAYSVAALEKNKKHYTSLDEEGLSAVLAVALSIPGLTVTQETNSNGHVDLTIVADHCVPPRIKLGEAKIYRGPEYHLNGLEQLLGRYTTGREGRGMLIVYCRQADVSGLMKKIRRRMDDELPMQQKGSTADHLVLKWSFLSTHAHSCGDDLDVGHVGCNLYVENS